MLERISASRQEKPSGVANGHIQRGNEAPALLAVVAHTVVEPNLKSNLLACIV